MAKYELQGEPQIEDDSTMEAFARSICSGIWTYGVDGEDEEEYKDNFMEIVREIIEYTLSWTDINYVELMYKYRSEIGNILYDIENTGGDPLTVSFFNDAKISFNKLVYYYIDSHFYDLVVVPEFV